MSTAEKLADALYKNWISSNNVPVSNDYDMRGFYNGLMRNDPNAISGINPNDNRLHFSDFWKLPNHPLFSTDSRYYDPATMPQTPSWQGGLLGTPQGKSMGAESWTLRRPNGDVVMSESPWQTNILRGLLQPEDMSLDEMAGANPRSRK